MTVRDVVLHSQYMITSQTRIRIMSGADKLAEGTKYEDTILAHGERAVVGMIWDGQSDLASIWVDGDG